MNGNYPHIGAYIRKEITEKNGLSVTKAATLLNIGRQQLSSVLNGKSSLSQELAEKIAKAFRLKSSELMRIQAEYAHPHESAERVRLYVPPFISIKAHEIEDWGKDNREKFPELIRRLCKELSPSCTSDFHAGRNNYRPGWDGIVDSPIQTDITPMGKSYWELSTSGNVTNKANKDIRKRNKQAFPNAEEKKDSTYVCVTSSNYRDAQKWEEAHKAGWKHSLLIDACKLEQILETAPFTQLWLAEQMGKVITGISSLQTAWERWANRCCPALPTAIFQSQVAQHLQTLNNLLSNKNVRIITISADSYDEMLAFLYCAFYTSEKLETYVNQTVVFHNAETLNKYQHTEIPGIAILGNAATQEQLCHTNINMRYIVLFDKWNESTNANISLTSMRHSDMEATLHALGKNNARCEKELKKCGCNRVFYRLLHMEEGLIVPAWCKNHAYQDFLMALSIIGVWDMSDSNNTALMERLSGMKKKEMKTCVTELYIQENSPIAKRNDVVKIISTHYILWLYKGKATSDFLDRYSSLIYEATQGFRRPQSSSEHKAETYLPTGFTIHSIQEICKQSVFFQCDITYSDAYQRFNRKLRSYWDELSRENIQDFIPKHHYFVPIYAELAPDSFLTMLRGKGNDFTSLKELYRNSSAYTGKDTLLRALEIITWEKKHFVKAINVLYILAEFDKNADGFTARRCLSKVFRWWMPQSTLNYDGLLRVLKNMYEKFPHITASILIEQMNTDSEIGEYSQKPESTLKDIPDNAGKPNCNAAALRYRVDMAELLFSKAITDVHHLSTLCTYVERWYPAMQLNLWSQIEKWTVNAPESDKAILREALRIRLLNKKAYNKTRDTAIRVHALLEPTDCCYKILFLFQTELVEYGYRRSFEACEKQQNKERSQGIAVLYEKEGIHGIRRLLTLAKRPDIVGTHAVKQVPKQHTKDLIFLALSYRGTDIKAAKLFLTFVLRGTNHKTRETIALQLAKNNDFEALHFFFMCSPCNTDTWNLLTRCGVREEAYWRECVCHVSTLQGSEVLHVIEHMIQYGRAREILHYAFHIREKLPNELLKTLLLNLANSAHEQMPHEHLERYCVGKILNRLRDTLSASTEELAKIQYAYAEYYTNDEIGLDLYNLFIKQNPLEFIRLIECASLRHTTSLVDDANRSHAYTLLNLIQPFTPSDTIEHITCWIEEVRSLAEKKALTQIADRKTGALLARFYLSLNGSNTEVDLFTLLENSISEHIVDAFNQELLNRGLNRFSEEQQKNKEIQRLVTTYREKAEKLQFEFPFVSSRIFEGTAQSLENFLNHFENDNLRAYM